MSRKICLLVTFTLLLLSSTAGDAQSPFTLTAGDRSMMPFGSTDISVTFTNTLGATNISFGIEQQDNFSATAIVAGSALASLNGGTGPWQFLVDLAPVGASTGRKGATVNIVAWSPPLFDWIPVGVDQEIPSARRASFLLSPLPPPSRQSVAFRYR